MLSTVRTVFHEFRKSPAYGKRATKWAPTIVTANPLKKPTREVLAFPILQTTKLRLTLQAKVNSYKVVGSYNLTTETASKPLCLLEAGQRMDQKGEPKARVGAVKRLTTVRAKDHGALTCERAERDTLRSHFPPWTSKDNATFCGVCSLIIFTPSTNWWDFWLILYN